MRRCTCCSAYATTAATLAHVETSGRYPWPSSAELCARCLARHRVRPRASYGRRLDVGGIRAKRAPGQAPG